MPTDHKKRTILTKSSGSLDRVKRVLPAFAATFFIQAIIVLIYINTGSESFSSLQSISILSGGSISVGGFILFITVFCFVWGLPEISFRGNPENGKADVTIYHSNEAEFYEFIELIYEYEKFLDPRRVYPTRGL